MAHAIQILRDAGLFWDWGLFANERAVLPAVQRRLHTAALSDAMPRAMGGEAHAV